MREDPLGTPKYRRNTRSSTTNRRAGSSRVAHDGLTFTTITSSALAQIAGSSCTGNWAIIVGPNPAAHADRRFLRTQSEPVAHSITFASRRSSALFGPRQAPVLVFSPEPLITWYANANARSSPMGTIRGHFPETIVVPTHPLGRRTSCRLSVRSNRKAEPISTGRLTRRSTNRWPTHIHSVIRVCDERSM